MSGITPFRCCVPIFFVCAGLVFPPGLLAEPVAVATATEREASLARSEAKVSGDASLVKKTSGGLVVRMTSASGQCAVEFNYPANDFDLSSFRDLAITVHNRSAAELDTVVIGTSDPANYSRSAQTRFLVRPYERTNLRVFLARPTLEKDHPHVKTLGNLYAFPWGHQHHWQHPEAERLQRVTARISWAGAKPGQTLTISEPFGSGTYSIEPALLATLDLPLVDDLGQARAPHWPGKILSPKELSKDVTRDLALARSTKSTFAKRSIYGGDTRAPRQSATGFFRVEKLGGKWWFIDPEGHLFWSLGVTGAGDSSDTRIKGREPLFPENIRSRDSINHYEENLKLKYGDSNWKKAHAEVTLARMRRWGFNTLGAWSPTDLAAAHRLPFTLIAHPNLNWLGGTRKIIDPYSEGFKKSLNSILAAYAADYADDPWLLGVFIENELDWKSGIALSEEVLRCGPRTPARRALVALLRERYPSVDALNQAWGSGFDSFDAVRPVPSARATAAYEKDLRDYLTEFADTFFAECAAAMDKHLPKHLYLGCRFHNWNPIITAAASRHCDVISVNAYRYSVADFALTTTVDRPYLIGEFHFGTRDHGVWGTGLTWAADARNQSDLVQAYLSDALRHPNIVGAHWFQWSNQPVTGRYDGENFGVGLVSIVDRPITSLVKAFTDVAKGLYDYRLQPGPARLGTPRSR